ncbi:MAG: 2-oxo acid dehydrogenase subunit E2 [Bacteroidales bacterium]|nr:2-oxo acid dehydrogenase subunit E2 [Bacteroidales bacterium]MCF8391545.1 2-oxo acid dehydrogenase subunit E2 [Bacteroidales bacterium]
MAIPILLPRQGQSVESCIISQIYVSVGDKVKVGTPLFSYETDKAAFEEEAKEEGIVLALFFNEGDEVPVLTNVGVIGEEGESFEEFEPGNSDKEAVSEESVKKVDAIPVLDEKPAETVISKEEIPLEDLYISPRAKKLAEKEALNYSTIKGSGPKGRIIENDIRAALAMQPKKTALAKEMIRQESLSPQKQGTGLAQSITSQDLGAANTVYHSDSEIVKLTNIRKLIAKAMYNSLHNSAQLTHHLSADARRILELRKKFKAAQNEGNTMNITLNDMICYAVIKTLKKYPNANSHFLGDSLRVFNKVHLGLAVDTERGLMVPVIKNADDLSIQGLSSQMKSIATACREGNVNPDLLSPEQASFTVSNLGNYGVEMFTPVINLPQVAILGVNTILPRPKDLGDGVYGFVPHLGLSLTYDHQALDGGEATRFVKSIADEIETLELDVL